MATDPAGPVVVAADEAAGSLAAVDFAVAEARAQQAPLRLLGAQRTGRDAEPHPLTGILRRVVTSWPGLAASAQELDGGVAEALLLASRWARLVVLSRHTPEPGRSEDWAATQVAAHALCPTVVVPAVADSGQGQRLDQAPVLLGLGMSADDEPAAWFAFEEAARWRVPLIAVHVWSGIPTGAAALIDPFAYDLGQAQAATDRIVTDALAGWAEKYPEVKVKPQALYDVHTTRPLQELTGRAGLAVVGGRRHSGFSSRPLGSVTSYLITHAACPVAVVRAGYR